MSMKLMVAAMSSKVGNPLRKLVLVKLADQANDHGECWPSFAHIADQCEMSRRSVIAHIKALEEAGFLTSEKRPGEKGNSSNIYRLHIEKAQSKKLQKPEVGSAGDSPGVVQQMHPPSAADSPPPSAGDAPRTSHSFESVNESCTVYPLREQPTLDEINFAGWPEEPDEQFEIVWPLYPRRFGSNPKRAALKAWRARIRAGENPKAMVVGMIRYIRFLHAAGDLGTRYVMQASRFFGPGKEYTSAWDIPPGQDEQSIIERMTSRDWATAEVGP